MPTTTFQYFIDTYTGTLVYIFGTIILVLFLFMIYNFNSEFRKWYKNF